MRRYPTRRCRRLWGATRSRGEDNDDDFEAADPAGIETDFVKHGPCLLNTREQLDASKPWVSALTATGEDLAQGVGFWYAFLTSFWGPKTMVLSKREGLLPGPGLAL